MELLHYYGAGTTTHSFYHGDARSMENFPSSPFVDLLVTDLPLWNPSNQNHAAHGEIGKEDTYHQYIYNLAIALDWIRRVSKNDAVLVFKLNNPQEARMIHFLQGLLITYLGEWDLVHLSYWQKVLSHKERQAGVSPIDPIMVFQKKKSTFDINHIPALINCPGRSFGDYQNAWPYILLRQILSHYSVLGGTVLDPFAGVSDLSVLAHANQMNSISIDIRQSFLDQSFDLLTESLKSFESSKREG